MCVKNKQNKKNKPKNTTEDKLKIIFAWNMFLIFSNSLHRDFLKQEYLHI